MEQRKLIIISFTETGSRKNAEICRKLPASGYLCEGCTVKRFADLFQLHALPKELKTWLSGAWGKANLLFIGSTGIAIRSVAHLVKDKYTDSAVIAMDEKAQYVIPLLSGHIGGAVEIAEDIAGIFGAQAVLTTASDVQRKFAVDVFAKKNQLFITDRVQAKEIAAAILAEKPVGFYSKYPFDGNLPSGLRICENLKELGQYEDSIAVTDEKTHNLIGPLQLMPANIVVGVGCRRNTSKQKLAAALEELLTQHGLSKNRVEVLVSIDLKQGEEGLLELVKDYQVPFRTYSADELKTVETGRKSSFVKEITGVGNVCESAARFYCPQGCMIQPKTAKDGMTFSLIERAVKLHFTERGMS